MTPVCSSSGKWGALIVVNRPITLHKPIQGYRSVAGHLDFALSEPQQGVQALGPTPLCAALWTECGIDRLGLIESSMSALMV